MIDSHVFPIGFQQFGILLICLIVAAAATPPLLAEPLRESGLGLSPAELRCEYRADPLGVDVSRPRLSWIVASAERGQRQTAYQVLVAGSEAILKLDKGDLWDSGQVQSDDTTAIVYGGKPLLSNQPCYWKVKVWDKDGTPSTWSSLAVWSMGLLEPSDWTDLWPQLFSDVNCIALWISSEKILTRLYSVLHWFHKRLEVNSKGSSCVSGGWRD